VRVVTLWTDGRVAGAQKVVLKIQVTHSITALLLFLAAVVGFASADSNYTFYSPNQLLGDEGLVWKYSPSEDIQVNDLWVSGAAVRCSTTSWSPIIVVYRGRHVMRTFGVYITIEANTSYDMVSSYFFLTKGESYVFFLYATCSALFYRTYGSKYIAIQMQYRTMTNAPTRTPAELPVWAIPIIVFVGVMVLFGFTWLIIQLRKKGADRRRPPRYIGDFDPLSRSCRATYASPAPAWGYLDGTEMMVAAATVAEARGPTAVAFDNEANLYPPGYDPI
jgi:hypothetical protein